jgi:hypothetical protein
MRVQKSNRLRCSARALWCLATFAVCAVAALEAPAGARDARVMPRVGAITRSTAVPAGAIVWRAVKPGAHVLYGTIATLNGMSVSMRLRSGQLFAFDATPAINSDNYSAPLFVGKTVSVDGNQAAGRFSATHIYRVSNLANLPADH